MGWVLAMAGGACAVLWRVVVTVRQARREQERATEWDPEDPGDEHRAGW